MNKLRKFFQVLSLVARRPSLLNVILQENGVWKEKVSRDHPRFENGLPVLPIDVLFPDFSAKIEPFSFLGGNTTIMDIALLMALAEKFKVKSYFEIGTWRGESVANVAKVVDECFTLNLSREEILQLNLPEEYVDQHGFFSKNIPAITHLFGNSRSYDFAGLDRKFDLIFIDGDHCFEMVKNDTRSVFEHLVHENSIVVWHDYAFDPEKVRYEVLSGILAGLPEKFKTQLFQVSNTLCAVMIPESRFSKPLSLLNLRFTKPAQAFSVNIIVKDSSF